MSIPALFDKSFLHSLNPDESVWFDHFFMSNVCPLFYVETLADLGKPVRRNRPPEQIVRGIAEKFPEMHGTPNAHHRTLCLGELLGHAVPMTGQIPIVGGKTVKIGDQSGVVFDQSPEAEAFSRWQKGEFFEIERLYAHEWRTTLTTLNLKEIATEFQKLGISGKSCRTIEDAKALADSVVIAPDMPFNRMKLAILFLNIHPQYHRQILERWNIANYPPLAKYAPYVAHVLTVELFFQIALAANLISTERRSNRLDIAYLFYLPFCTVIISVDRLHRKCTPLFLRRNQEFLWGPDLKKDLSRLNEHYSILPTSTKEQGVMSFAGAPPKQGQFLVAELWDRHLPGWRDRDEVDLSKNSVKESEIIEQVSKFADAPALSQNEIDFDPTNPDSITLHRIIRKKKGSWYQVPKDIPPID